jgi:hypothetical protein
MRQWHAIILLGVCGVVLWLCAGCGSSGGSLAFDPTNPPVGDSSPTLPAQFSTVQGASNWYYYSATPGQADYQLLSWAAAPAGTPYAITGGWQNPAAPALLIASGKLRPGNGADAVLAWRAPMGERVEIDATVASLVNDPQGDGISLGIWHNGAQVGGPTVVPDLVGQSPTVSTTRTVQAGDMIYIRINPRQTAASDWFTYQVKVRAM